MIPGSLVSLLTFPGVIVHEIAHRFFCDVAKVPVYKICYFRLGNPAGYVIHDETHNLKDAFLISIGPLLINTVLCALLTFPAVFPITILSETEHHFTFMILMWVGFSVGMHAFPSDQDMESFLEAVKSSKKTGVLFGVAKGFACLLGIVNSFKGIWIDAFYAFGISMILPWLLGML